MLIFKAVFMVMIVAQTRHSDIALLHALDNLDDHAWFVVTAVKKEKIAAYLIPAASIETAERIAENYLLLDTVTIKGDIDSYNEEQLKEDIATRKASVNANMTHVERLDTLLTVCTSHLAGSLKPDADVLRMALESPTFDGILIPNAEGKPHLYEAATLSGRLKQKILGEPGQPDTLAVQLKQANKLSR